MGHLVNDTVHRQIDAIEAQLEILKAQLMTLRHAIPKTAPPKVKVELPPRPASCATIADEACGLRDEDARIPRGNFTDPHGWQCRGCRKASAELSTTTT
jgi:hypothetical protein